MAKKQAVQVELVRSAVLNGTPAGFDHDPILEIVDISYKGKTERVVGIEWSGRFDGDLDKMLDFIVKLLKEHQPDNFFMTEFQQKGAKAKLRKRLREEFGKKYDVEVRGEFMAISQRSTMRRMAKVRALIHRFTKVAGYADWRNMRAAAFTYRIVGLGVTYRSWITHGPSGIQAGSDMKEGKQAQIARKGWPRLGRKARRWMRRKKNRIVSVKGDSNGDHKNMAWLNRFEDWLQMTSIWRIDPSHEGTHTTRQIDVSWWPELT